MSLLALVLSILFCTSIAPNPVDKKTGDDTPAIQGCSGRSPISLVEVTKTIKEYSNLFYYKEGKNIALKYYPDYGLQFVGYGYAKNFEDIQDLRGTRLPGELFGVCQTSAK